MTNEDTTMNTHMEVLIKKVVDIFDVEYLMKLERQKGEEMTRELSDLMDRHLAMNEALPHQDTVNLAPMVTGMARQLSILGRLQTSLETLEAELKDLVENAGWKRTNCLLYTSPSPRDRTRSRMPSSA